MLDCITRKKQLFNEATTSNSASIDKDCEVRHTRGIQLPHTEMQIETRDVNKSCCVLFFFPSYLFCSEEALQKNSSQHWDFEGSLEGEYVERVVQCANIAALEGGRRPVQKRREKERRRNPPRRWSAGFVRGPHGVPSSYDRIS